MNRNYDFPEVVHPPSHFHHAHSYDLKNLDPFGSQPIYGDSEEGTGTSRWSSMRRSRKFWAIAGTVLLVLVMAGAIAGGIIGSDLVKQKPSTPEQPLTDDVPSPPSPTSLPPTNEDFSRPHESSRLATGYGGTTTSNFRLVLLQDVDGDLAAVEWRGSAGEHYKIKNRLSGDSEPDKPAEDSPLSLLKFGPQGDLHLFYFNEDLSFCHLVRRGSVAPGGDNSWEIGALSAGDSDISFGFAPSLPLKLSATVLPGDWTSLDADCMVLMYWTDETIDSVALLSSTDPETRGSWRSGKFSLSTGSLGLEPHPTSSGFLMMAIQRPVDNKGSDELTGGLRLVWDLDDNSQQRTFGIMDCVFTDENALSSCQTNRAKWEDTEAEKIVLEAQKPLLFSSRNFEANDTPDNSTRYLMRVLDSRGQLTELLWDDGTWMGHQSFEVNRESLPDDETTNFAHVASSDDNLLYTVAGGRVAEYASHGSWWVDGEAAEWTFVDHV